MRLYPKRLRSIEDLEKEKKLLLKEAKLLEEQDLFSVEGIFGKKGGKEDGDEEGSILDLLNYLPISNPLFDVGIKLAKTWFANRRAKKEKESGGEWEKESEGKGKEKNRERAEKEKKHAAKARWQLK